MKFIIIFIMISQILIADVKIFHEDYDNKTNSEVVKDLANLMHNALIENQGVI